MAGMDSLSNIIMHSIEINKFNRYIEVMLGAGESLLQFNPKIPCLLNDSNTDLINFYKNIHEPELQIELRTFANNWKLIGKYCSFSANEIFMAFQDFNKEIISAEDVAFMIRAIVLMNMNHEDFNPLFEKKFIVSIDMFSNAIIKSVVDTLLKLKGDDNLTDSNGSYSEYFAQNIETAIRSGIYEHFKNLINWQKTELIDCISLNKHLAIWFFIKELSKGHHLSYNKSGNFKNHYAGIEYNNYDLSVKVEQVCDTKFIEKIQNAELYNYNITDFIKEVNAKSDDVVIANFICDNLILANGKNYSGIVSQLDQIKQIINLDTNLVILLDDESVASEFQQLTAGKLKVKKYNKTYLLSNLIG